MKQTILGAAYTAILLAASGAANAISVSGQGTWESTLQGRDLDGDVSTFEAYYDTVLDITWLADANYAGTTMLWSAANAWVNGLTLGGHTDWRLPTTTDTGASGCNWAYTGTDCGYNVDTASSEMAHMFYTTLGDLAFYDTAGVGGQQGYGLSNAGPFSNLKPYFYFSATEYAPSPLGNVWTFYFITGSQDDISKTNGAYAWAVHDGDVGAANVPVPAAAWLFGSGLLGLVGMNGKRRR